MYAAVYVNILYIGIYLKTLKKNNDKKNYFAITAAGIDIMVHWMAAAGRRKKKLPFRDLALYRYIRII